MPKAAKSKVDMQHIKDRQREFIDKMFEPIVTANLKNGTKIAGRYAGCSSHNNAQTAIKTGGWEVYSEAKIVDEGGNMVTVDMMDVDFFS